MFSSVLFVFVCLFVSGDAQSLINAKQFTDKIEELATQTLGRDKIQVIEEIVFTFAVAV